MKIQISFISLLLLLTPAAISAASKDDAEIRSAVKNFTAAANALDLNRTMACYADKPNVSGFSPGPSEPIVGLTAVRKNWSDFFALIKSNHSELSDITVESDGSLAFAYFTTTEAIVMKDGTRVKPLFRSTMIYQKIEGHWLIVHEHKSEPREK
jgi:ketosteroid isomerase-like protein